MIAKFVLVAALCAAAHAFPGLLEKDSVVIGGIAPAVKTAPQPIHTVITKAALPVWGIGKTIVQAQPISIAPSLVSKGVVAAPILKGGLDLGHGGLW